SGAAQAYLVEVEGVDPRVRVTVFRVDNGTRSKLNTRFFLSLDAAIAGAPTMGRGAVSDAESSNDGPVHTPPSRDSNDDNVLVSLGLGVPWAAPSDLAGLGMSGLIVGNLGTLVIHGYLDITPVSVSNVFCSYNVGLGVGWEFFRSRWVAL